MVDLTLKQTNFITLVEFKVSAENKFHTDKMNFHLCRYLFDEIVPWIENQGFTYKDTTKESYSHVEYIITEFTDGKGGSFKVKWGGSSFTSLDLSFHECLEIATLFKLTFKI